MDNKNNSSIGFFETVDIFILYKKNIFIFFIIFFLFSLTYVYLDNEKQKFNTKFIFSGTTDLESKKIKELNQMLREIHTNRLIKQSLVLSGTNIIPQVDIFEENVLYGKTIFKQIKISELFNHFYILISTKEIQERVNNKFQKKYPSKVLPEIIISPIRITEFKIPFFYLHIIHTDRETIKDYSEILFQETTQETLNLIRENIEQTESLFYDNKQKALESLRTQNTIVRNEFKNKMKEIILNLQEQAKIARKMQLAMPPELSQTENVLSRMPFEYSPSNSSTSLIFNSSANYNYLRGYISLEEEINLIKQRNRAEDFVPIIRNNIQAINKLKNDKFGTHEIEEINKYDFSLINFYNFIKEEKTIVKNYIGLNKNIFYLLFSLCGIILGIIFSILHYSYKKYKLLN
mgnify:CR=1 FL=1